ncbi:hypothetical protein [Synechococcus sp. CBW1006]|uniref:hypothetical protein n=1 Tax=Synechococcus sp. CBW1006 TaxID=1353138 RepID=UPI0018CEE78E|nr:hypothetical protein [Synechococcus sp. CBW1006]QPN66849.1 hypothetical protein H8F26_00595 [Synechococcus sp. CBW1006]
MSSLIGLCLAGACLGISRAAAADAIPPASAASRGLAPAVIPVNPSAVSPARPPAASAPAASPAAAATPGVPPQPYPPEVFALLLEKGSLEQIEQACLTLLDLGDDARVRQLHTRLMTLHPAPQPLAVVLANAHVLISCRAPQQALAVLDRFGPAAGGERQQWLLLQWRAANAGLDHRRAAEALWRLAAGDAARLEAVLLPVKQAADGTTTTRVALDQLAEHYIAQGRRRQAAEVLLASRVPGVATASRLQQAAALLETLPLAERDSLYERALEQAAAAGAWGLVTQLLDDQARLQAEPGGDPSRAIERRLRLSGRIDDAYGEWLLRRQDPAASDRSRQLERQLRSPRDPGGHQPTTTSPAAAVQPNPVPATGQDPAEPAVPQP